MLERTRLTAAIFGAMLVGAPAAAQTPERVPLAEALRRAEAHHPDLPIQTARVLRAEADVQRARAGRYPSGELRTIFGIVNGAQVGEVPDGLPEELAPLFSTDGQNDLLNDLGPFVQNMIRLDQVIYTFGKIDRGVAAARLGVEAEQVELERRTDEVRFEVKQIVYGYQLAAQLESVLGEVEDNFAEALEQARERLQNGSGDVTQSDVLKLEVAKNGFTQRRLELRRTKEESLFAFRRALGLDLDAPVAPEGDRIRPVEVGPLESGADRAAALDAPAYRAAAVGLEAREEAVAVAQSRLWPDIFAGVLFEANWALRRDDVQNQFLFDRFNLIRGGPFLGVRWELDFATKLAAVAAAEADAAEQRAQRDRAATGVPLAIERARLKVKEKREALDAAQRSRKAGRALSFLTAANFRMGIGDAREILEAYGLYARATSEYHRAIFDFNVAVAELSKALGRPVEVGL